MRTEEEVESFRADAARIVQECDVCSGSMDSDCDCVRKFQFEVEAYEACIPRDFWYVTTPEVTINVENFEKYIKKYIRKLSVAHRKGYGLILMGTNGTGKSTFVSYIGANSIRKGRTCYYTTLPDLSHNMKKGFDDKEAKARLELMLTSDILILDEMNKEFFKETDKISWMKTELERLLKKRFDENQPVIIATNASASQLIATYGPTVASMLSGKYQSVRMEPGDIRPRLKKKMSEEMGF